MDNFECGQHSPLGALHKDSGWNFAVYSDAPVEELVIAPLHNPSDKTSYPLDPEKNRTGNIWHIFIKSAETELLYAFKVNNILLIDPYAKLIKSGNNFGKNAIGQEKYKVEPLGVAQVSDHFNWDNDSHPAIPTQDLVIYEMHIRGITKDRSSHTASPATYLGVIEKIPYLKQLGINAVELLPIFEFDEAECLQINPLTNKRLYNYWGYQPLSFFCPMQRYATTSDPIAALRQCKEMVKALHSNGIEVILDIVFNHTGEGNEKGHTVSWKGFSDIYYMRGPDGEYLNYSGCGNTLNCNHPIVQDMLIASLHYWVTEMHIDGFRFDLASILTRGQNGDVLESSPLLDRIANDPVLADTKLIAEPWDAAGLHQVGHYCWKCTKAWIEWNDDFRSVVRNFIRGSDGFAGKFATKLCGSEDIYGEDGSPLNSLNFITCHDGFTMRDLVSYEEKHNRENGEQNRDGGLYYDTWNCGVEGKTKDLQIERLRERQMKNFCVALLVSAGVPMILMGDEYGHTKRGNNNTWCQDNSLNWFLWDELERAGSLTHFWKEMLEFRNSNPILRRRSFYTSNDIQWHGLMPNQPDWSPSSHLVAYTVIDHDRQNDIYIAFNASSESKKLLLPAPPDNRRWSLFVNTSDPTNSPLHSNSIEMGPYSSLILKAQDV